MSEATSGIFIFPFSPGISLCLCGLLAVTALAQRRCGLGLWLAAFLNLASGNPANHKGRADHIGEGATRFKASGANVISLIDSKGSYIA